MADDTSTPFPSAAGGGAGRGGRPPGNRDAGGFRIRLSDNEMQAARALQEAFGLRSTVAVLGFALRTLAQQLEQGQLEELVAQHRAQVGTRGPAPRADDRRREGPPQERGGGGGRVQRIDPFARPSRPAAAPAAAPASDDTLSSSESTEPSGDAEADAEIDADQEVATIEIHDDDAMDSAVEVEAEGSPAKVEPT
jgi:hypothetical protein